MSFAGITASHLVAAIQYRSIKFTTLPVAKAEEIARALLLRVPLDEIEAVQQDPGKGNWTVIFKTITAAERLAEKGFTLLNEHISPVLYNKRLITATVDCPDLAAQSTATSVALAVVENPESAQTSSPPLPSAEESTAEPAAAASQDLFEENSPTMDKDSTAQSDPPSENSAVENSEEEEPSERPRSRSPINRAEQRQKNGQQSKKKKDRKKHK